MPHSPVSESSIKNSVDIKANGEMSRMRSHKGNMPSLPQTKYCALCPAKFTRTTHLNRHLRSHTNERAHRCNICNAEFTRSDLLTRHKRTCGDSNVNKSRRKSCQACAESKVKCNLQHPCSKCAARGRECVFINDPEASRNRKSVYKRAQRSPSSPTETDFSESSTGFDGLGPSSPTSMLSFSSHGVDNISHLVSSSHLSSQLLPNSAFNASDCSSACSSRSSPRLDYFDPRQDLSDAFNMNFDTIELDSELHHVFPTTLDPFMEDPFSPCLPRVQTETDLSTWFGLNQPSSSYGTSEPPIYSQPHQTIDQDLVSGLTNLTPASFSKSSISRQPYSMVAPGSLGTATLCASSAPGNPTTEELDQYLYLFFTEFSTQIPLLHRPTWKMESTHPILVRAMQACGALFVKNHTAMEFIIKTLTSSRDTLLIEFSRPTCTLKEHMCLMLAVVLLQSIGLLQPRPDQRPLSRTYHDILVMMIRKTGLITLIGSWPPPDLSNPALLESAWKDWARYETFKRQDCSYCVYYSAAPSFLPSEFDLSLPCDDALWKAQSAREWYQTQRTQSPYGTGIPRILGIGMQLALAALKEPTPSMVPYTVNPFAAFVLIHSIFRDVFCSPQASGTNHGTGPHSSMLLHGRMSNGNSAMIHCALHNWQRMWSSSPEAVHSEKHSQGVPFVFNALPFYWLARFAEATKQNGLMQVNPLMSRNDVEERYRLLKGWLSQIHTSLRNGSQVSSNLWNNPTSVGMPQFAHVSI